MKNKNTHALVATVLCLILAAGTLGTVNAQRSEFGLFGGTSFYIGDLNPTKLFAQPKMAGGFLYRYNLSPRWALKGDFLFSKVGASDVLNNGGYERNLSFTSPITELSVEAELNFLKLYNSPGKNRFAPYIFAGISLFSFDPKATINGTTYELQCLGTEGQGLDGGPEKKYSLTSVAIPFGIGIKCTIGRYFSIGAEWGMRYTFTDYLDDVSGVYYDNDMLRQLRGDLIADLADRSPELTDATTGLPLSRHSAGTQRGNTTTTDLYSFAGVTFTVKFGNEDKTCDVKLPRKRR